MSIIELLIVLFCVGGLLVILAVGAWVLVNKSKLEQPDREIDEELQALDREYAGGDLDEADYDARRAELMRRRRMK